MTQGVPQQTPTEDTPLPWGTLTLLAAAVFAAITTEVLPVGLLPLMAASLGVGEGAVGLLVSVYAVVVAVGCIPLTALVVRWPRHHVLVAVLLLYALSNGLLAVATAYPVAVLARLLGGLAHAVFFSVVFTAAVSLVPATRMGRAVAFVGAGNALGLAMGVPLGAAVGNELGWRWVVGGFALLLALLAGLCARRLPRGGPPAGSAQEPVLRAVRRGPLLRVAAVVVLVVLGHYTAFTYVSLLLLRSGVTQDRVSLVLLGYGVAGVLGLLAAGAMADRRPRAGLTGAVALTVACLVGLALVGGSTGLTVTTVVVWGAAFGALPTLLQTAAFRATPQAPDAAPAVVNATFNVGIAGGALLGAQQLGLAGPGSLAVTGAAIVGVSLLLVVLPGGRVPVAVPR